MDSSLNVFGNFLDSYLNSVVILVQECVVTPSQFLRCSALVCHVVAGLCTVVGTLGMACGHASFDLW